MFLTNTLLGTRVQQQMGLPLEFISFGLMPGSMYKHWQNKGTFVVQHEKQSWGNDVVYGAIFLLRDDHFYIRAIDAFMACSKSMLNKNHINDVNHRITTAIIPISFPDEEAFCTLRYTERESIRAQTYVGNPKHPKITQQIYQGSRPNRILSGCDRAYTQLLREVLHE